ncbi:MAG: hypothetical protein ACRDPT_06945 [Streptomycetales bacterium]
MYVTVVCAVATVAFVHPDGYGAYLAALVLTLPTSVVLPLALFIVGGVGAWLSIMVGGTAAPVWALVPSYVLVFGLAALVNVQLARVLIQAAGRCCVRLRRPAAIS